MSPTAVHLRAEWLLPVIGKPISGGEIVVEDGRIAAVHEAARAGTDDVVDFGPAILMPGLVNVHTHLEYTVMRGLLEEVEFFPWIRELTARKTAITPEEWVASATVGAAEAVAGGVTTIGDCTDSGAALDGARALGLRGIVYQEVFGIAEEPSVKLILAELAGKVERLRATADGSGIEIGISPHAPYTVRPALMRALAGYAGSEGLPLCIHAAESQAEASLLQDGSGPFAQMYARRGIAWSAPHKTSVAYLDSLGILGPRTLLVHGVQLSLSDRAIVRESGSSWAHCPKSNAKLGVGVATLGVLGDFRHPDQAWRAHAGVPVGIGSDSVASNNTMDMFEEMRFAVLLHRAARRRIAALTAQDAIAMATLGGARALGLEREIGSLEPGKRADICAVRVDELHSTPCYDPYSALVYAARASDVCYTMIDGSVRYNAALGLRIEERFPEADLLRARAALRGAAGKMREWGSEVK